MGKHEQWEETLRQAYRRILKNAEQVKGVMLKPHEVRAMADDPAIYRAAQNERQVPRVSRRHKEGEGG